MEVLGYVFFSKLHFCCSMLKLWGEIVHVCFWGGFGPWGGLKFQFVLVVQVFSNYTL